MWSRLFNLNLYAAPSLREIVEHWSPVIYQSTEGREDYITNFDFDSNWYGKDNWEHFDCYPLRAYVYYSIIESTDHYFISYFFFHPRDTGNPAYAYIDSHENDFEGCRFLILKDGSTWGNLLWLETILHGYRDFYNGIEYEDSRPVVYVTPSKHAVYGKNFASQSWDCDYLSSGCVIFPSKSGTGVVYRYRGIAEEPSNTNDRDVSYELIDMKDTIWARRFDNPLRNCDEFIEDHIRLSLDSCGYILEKAQFGAKFGGDNYTIPAGPCRATPPWNFGFDNEGIWFIDPLLHYQNAQGRSWLCVGERYIYNPYLYSSSGCPQDCRGIEIVDGLLVTKSADKYNIEEGESVTYNYEVYNVGVLPATNVQLNDNQLGLIGIKSLLDSHQTWTTQKTVTLNQPTTNYATTTSTYYYYCGEYIKTNLSNEVTVTVGNTPPPEPPEEPEPPEPPMPEAEVVWYWDNIHSFTENEHSLESWLKGKTAKAFINEKGYIEINVDPLQFPNVLSSPDFRALLLGERFDAIRMLYLNLIEYHKGKAIGMIGWLDETVVDKERKIKLKNKAGKFMIEFPLESGSDFTWRLIVLKDHPGWNKEAQTLGLTFVPAYYEREAQGKFLIWRIELIKMN